MNRDRDGAGNRQQQRQIVVAKEVHIRVGQRQDPKHLFLESKRDANRRTGIVGPASRPDPATVALNIRDDDPPTLVGNPTAKAVT